MNVKALTCLLLVVSIIGLVVAKTTTTTTTTTGNPPFPTGPPPAPAPDTTPGCIPLSATIYDQAPAYMTHSAWPSNYFSFNGWTDNPSYGDSGTANNTNGFWVSDFELPMWMFAVDGKLSNGEYGLVGATCTKQNYPNCGKLGADGTPQYVYSGRSPFGTVQSPDSFYNWFHSTAESKTVPYNFSLDPVTGGKSARLVMFSISDFFPIDGRGWQDYGWGGTGSNEGYHNFAFCVKSHSTFTYYGGEIFNFIGDDDLFIFIDGYLMIDLGGVHGALNATIALDDYNTDNGGWLQQGEQYIHTFDMFYCERHTTASEIAVTTTIQFVCANGFDGCGACGGDGQSCCGNLCDDQDICTVDSCGLKVTTNCSHIEIPCLPANFCVNAVCDKKLGCQQSIIDIDDHNACTNEYCNPKTGVVRSNVTCNPNSCYTAACDMVKGCVYTHITMPVGDACTSYTCDNVTGIAPHVKTCTAVDQCHTSICNTTTGNCDVTVNTCNDGKLCTSDYCNPSTGQCSNTPINCIGDNCNNATCDPGNGQCTNVTLICSGAGTCKLDQCIPPNACYSSAKSCDPGNNCDFVEKDCSTGNPCSIGICTNSTGDCSVLPQTSAFCVPCGGVACNYDDPCNPSQCVNGTCQTTPYSCVAPNLCSLSTCVAVNGSATCQVSAKNCPASLAPDACTPVTCADGKGCGLGTSICEDYNPCTVDTCYSNGTCSNVLSTTLCDDQDVCTNDYCSSSNATTPCQHTDISCPGPNACQVAVACDKVKGCQPPAPKVCPQPEAFCLVPFCDNFAGCSNVDKSCLVTDPDCYIGVCNNGTNGNAGSCSQKERSNFGTITTSKHGGITCLLAYKQKEVAAITAGGAAGIAIGGAAAVGLLGYGGKKGYDMWSARGSGANTGVTNNPLYEESENHAVNPLYGTEG